MEPVTNNDINELCIGCKDVLNGCNVKDII